MPPPDAGKSRLAYIDWMRGLACVLMFQTHCYDSWLSPQARQSRFFMYSQLGGTFPAPLFLFLAGISFALVTEKLRQKNFVPRQIAKTTIRRGAEIFGFGLLFRLQEYVVSWGWAPRSDLFRVDILNTIGVSMMLMGVVCWIVLAVQRGKGKQNRGNMWGQPPSAVQPGEARQRIFFDGTGSLILTAAGTAVLISLLTPPLWTTWRPRWLPWPLESYVNGVHNLGTPQAWLFPIFPWAAFAFAGLAVGFILLSEWCRAAEVTAFFSLGACGVGMVELSRWLDARPQQLYSTYDYWHTSPNFFLIRVGMLLMILTASYAWCRWVIGRRVVGRWPVGGWGVGEWIVGKWPVAKRGAGQLGFSPLIQLGQASLLVYWVHIEFVYGRVSILPKHAQGIGGASLGLLTIFLAILALAYIRTHTKGWMKGRGAGVMPGIRRTPVRTIQPPLCQ